MMAMAFWSLLLFCLTVERGWVGDFLGQMIIGLAFGAAVAEGIYRFICFTLKEEPRKAWSSFLPLLAFGLHAYAMTLVSNWYLYTIAISAALAGIIWGINLFSVSCDGISDKVIETTGDIAQHGG